MVVHKNPSKKCDHCDSPFLNVFYDAKTIDGPWGNLCTHCFCNHGVGLGTGRGQRYQKRDDGKWEKTHG